MTFALRKIPVCVLLPYFSKEKKHLCTQLPVLILCPCVKRSDLRPEHFTFQCLFSFPFHLNLPPLLPFPKEKQKDLEKGRGSELQKEVEKKCEGKREEKWAGKLDEK